MNVINLICNILFVLIFASFSFTTHANKNEHSDKIIQSELSIDPTLSKLDDIVKNISLRKKEIDEKLKILKKVQTEQEKEKIQFEIDSIQQAITEQEASFEMILTAGIELDIDETVIKKHFDWQHDLIEILQPFLRELHKLTENKRKLDNLHSRIIFHQREIQKINEVLKRILAINQGTLRNESLAEFKRIKQKWQDQLKESKHLFEVAQLQRDEMTEFQTAQGTSFFDYIHEFAEGRGATLLLAFMAFTGIYLIMLLILRIFSWVINRRNKKRIFLQRVIAILYHFLMGILAISAFFYVLDVRDDLVMTGITIVFLISIAWVLKNSISTYIDEVRLFLNTGSAREGECIIYNGITMQIESLRYYTKLKNPFLPDLELRLTLSELTNYVSRPVSMNEPWFPCKVGDYVMLYGDIYGMVKYITLENVVLSLPDGTMPITFTIEDFFFANPRNFSSGFIARTEFGIDFKHLEICTIEIPRIMCEGIQRGIFKESFGSSLKDMSVNFSKADSTILEYEIIAIFDGRAASEFYSILRALQRYAVEVCNQQQWVLVAE